jgi:hypothetical protein
MQDVRNAQSADLRDGSRLKPQTSRSSQNVPDGSQALQVFLLVLTATLFLGCGSVRSEEGDATSGGGDAQISPEVQAVEQAEAAMYESYCTCSSIVGAKYENKKQCLESIAKNLGFVSSQCLANAVVGESDAGASFTTCAREVFDNAKQCSDECGDDWVAKDCLGKLHSGVQFCMTKLSDTGSQLAPACFFLPQG